VAHISPVPDSLAEGDILTISCNIQIISPSVMIDSILWSLNGVYLTPAGQRLKVKTSNSTSNGVIASTLVFNQLQPLDSG